MMRPDQRIGPCLPSDGGSSVLGMCWPPAILHPPPRLKTTRNTLFRDFRSGNVVSTIPQCAFRNPGRTTKEGAKVEPQARIRPQRLGIFCNFT